MPASTPLQRLLERLHAPMAERGWVSRKRPIPAYLRALHDAELALVLHGRGHRGLWSVDLRVSITLKDVARWYVARGLAARPCELLWHVPQDALRAALPSPSSLAWARGLALADPSADPPAPRELARQGRTRAEVLHPDARLDEAARVVLELADRFAPACLRACDDLRPPLGDPALTWLRERLPNWSRDGAVLVALAHARAPDLAPSVAAALRARAAQLDPSIAEALRASVSVLEGAA